MLLYKIVLFLSLNECQICAVKTIVMSVVGGSKMTNFSTSEVLNVKNIFVEFFADKCSNLLSKMVLFRGLNGPKMRLQSVAEFVSIS